MNVRNGYVTLFLFLVACSSAKNSSEQKLAFKLSDFKKINEPKSASSVTPKFEFRPKSHKHYWHCLSTSDCYTEYSGSFYLHDLNTGVVPQWASIETDLRHGTCNVNFEVDSSSEFYNFQTNSQYTEYGWAGKRDSKTERIVGRVIFRSPIYGVWHAAWKSENCE
ncbi:hypothetical protein [Photobacterium lipolyticum]|uniref:hypothetical protein n=1 Tax=Photobacterium lipolyticum TaxID=266810 RepID=UPI0011B20169|nr:hypothetical protein [Photobacterium lipolyticum]